VVYVFGVPIAPDDASWLVGELHWDAHADAVAAALKIQRALDMDLRAIALEPAERTAVLGVLDDPPAGLAELRGRLMQDHTWRQSA
jgi:hypothetical protein